MTDASTAVAPDASTSSPIRFYFAEASDAPEAIRLFLEQFAPTSSIEGVMHSWTLAHNILCDAIELRLIQRPKVCFTVSFKAEGHRGFNTASVSYTLVSPAEYVGLLKWSTLNIEFLGLDHSSSAAPEDGFHHHRVDPVSSGPTASSELAALAVTETDTLDLIVSAKRVTIGLRPITWGAPEE